MHFPQGEIYGGELVTPFEPCRIEYVLRRLKEVGLTDVAPPAELDQRALGVHPRSRLSRVARECLADWTAGNRGEIIPSTSPAAACANGSRKCRG